MDPTVRPLTRWAAMGTIVLTVLGWSSIPLFLKHFSKDIDFLTANGWRYVFSALLWAPVLVLGYFRKSLPKGLWKAALVPGILNAVGQFFFGLAPYFIDAGLMTFSLRVQVVFVSIGAAIMFESERAILRKPAFIAGLLLVLGSTLATVALKPGGITFDASNSDTIKGVLIAVAAGVAYAGYSLSVRKTMGGIPAFTGFAAVLQYSGVLLVVPMLIWAPRHGGVALDLPGKAFMLLILSSIIGIGLGHTMYYFSLARLGVAVSSGVVQLQPIVVSLGSIWLFDEKFTTPQWVTGSLAILGAMWMLIVQHLHHARTVKEEEVALTPGQGAGAGEMAVVGGLEGERVKP